MRDGISIPAFRCVSDGTGRAALVVNEIRLQIHDDERRHRYVRLPHCARHLLSPPIAPIAAGGACFARNFQPLREQGRGA
ncbi:MAG TPA: hypothetical protein VH855_05955 [Acetobacteraceae bacterium]|jgi:hypothetical protein